MFLEREVELKDQFKDIQKENADLVADKGLSQRYINKLNDIIDDLRSKVEEETQIRKVFENKLNDLHSIVRDRDASYNRAKIDLDHLLQDNIDKDNKLQKLHEEFKDVSKLKVAYEIKFQSTNRQLMSVQKEYERDKIEKYKENKALETELKKVKDSLKDVRIKLNESNKLVEGISYKI